MKKFLSVLLAVLMLAVMLPVVSLADTTEVVVTPENAASLAFNGTSDVTFKFAAGDYGAFKAIVGANTNVTFKGVEGANFTSFEVTYKVNKYNETDKSASTMKVEGLNVAGIITINSADGTLIVNNNKAKQISVTMNRQDGKENANIQISNNILNGGDYGIYLVPNHSGYKLTISGNEFNNIKKHAIAIMGNQSDIPATPETMTAADTISVTQNTFNSYGMDGKPRAAFKIWNDTKLAPADSEAINKAAATLIASIKCSNTFSKNLGENCVAALVYDSGVIKLDPPTPPEEEGPTTIVIIPDRTETPKTDDQKNPSTGANDMVAAAAAFMAVAALGMSILSRKK